MQIQFDSLKSQFDSKQKECVSLIQKEDRLLAPLQQSNSALVKEIENQNVNLKEIQAQNGDLKKEMLTQNGDLKNEKKCEKRDYIVIPQLMIVQHSPSHSNHLFIDWM